MVMSKPWESEGSGLQLPDLGRMLQAAEDCRVTGRLAEGEALCRRVLSVSPGHPEATHLLGLLAYAHGNLDLALDYLRQACRAPQAPARHLSNLAELCRQARLLPEGERAARRAVALDGTMAGAWNNLGIILQESGELEESRTCLERALELKPDNAEAHNNLANTCKRLDLLEAAERHWQRALALRPDYPEALSNTVVLLTEQGHYALAEEYGRRALRLNPKLEDAYVNLASLATACFNHEAALELLDALLRVAPDHAEGMAARALALRQLDRLDAAHAAARRAVALAPESADIHLALGVVLQAMGRVEEALATFEQAETLSGGTAERALISQGRLLMEHGRTTEAQAAFERALAAVPHSAGAWSGYADLHKFTPGDPHLAAMEAQLAAGKPPPGAQRTLLHFALGKAFLDIGDSDKAFLHLNQGNAMKRAATIYDAAASRRWMTSISEACSAEVLNRLAGSGVPSRLPIFVLGMPRSGTTLVEQILASHSEVHGAGELKYLHRLANRFGPYPASVARLDAPRLAELGRAYLAQVVPFAGGRRHVVDKMPSNFLYAGLIPLLLPGARIIHCRRDPVDTCLSCYSKLFGDEQSFTYDLVELGAYHRAYQQLMAHWRSVLPAGQFIEVDYEAVVDDTEREARRLLDFLELPWEEACLTFYRTERPVRTASVNQVRQPVYRSSSGRWRQHARKLGPLLAALGIAPDPAAQIADPGQGARG
jgi:tetratricopeptide (TPR) repeat protein